VVTGSDLNVNGDLYGAYQYDAKMDDADSKLEACDASVCDIIWASSGGLLIQDICWLFSTLLF